MNSAWRPLLQLSLLGACLTGCLAGCETPDTAPEIGFVEWGFVQSNAATTSITATNNVRVVEYFDADSQSFSYLTGAESSVVDDHALRQALQPVDIPDTRIAAIEVGSARVQVFAFESTRHDEFTDLASETARALDLVTKEIWPGEPTAVRVDVFIMPDDQVFSLGKRVDWKSGDPYEIAMFPMTSDEWPEIATHELYHVLTARWSVGTKGPERNSQPNAAMAFEEVAAAMFAHCAVLLKDGELAYPSETLSAAINERPVDPAGSSEDLAFVLEVISKADRQPEAGPLGTLLGKILDPVPLRFYLGNDELLMLELESGRSYLSLCRDIAAEPMRLGLWFEQIAADSVAGTRR